MLLLWIRLSCVPCHGIHDLQHLSCGQDLLSGNVITFVTCTHIPSIMLMVSGAGGISLHDLVKGYAVGTCWKLACCCSAAVHTTGTNQIADADALSRSSSHAALVLGQPAGPAALHRMQSSIRPAVHCAPHTVSSCNLPAQGILFCAHCSLPALRST